MMFKNILISIFTIFTSLSFAQSRYYHTQISLNEGLSSSSMTSILRGSDGMLWVGTRHGLNRHNGYEIDSYFYSSLCPLSIPGNRILFITETENKTVLIGTNMGVVRYCNVIDGFIPILSDSVHVNTYLFCKTEEDVYFWGDSNLYQYNSETNECSVLFTLKDKLSLNVSTITEGDIKGEFIFGTNGEGLWRIDSNNDEVEKLEWYTYSSVMVTCRDDKHNIWVAPYGEGVVCYNSQGEKLADFNRYNSKLKQDVVISLMYNNEKIWVGTDGGGVAIIDLQSMVLNEISYKNEEVAPDNTITCFASNRGESVWVGTNTSGLFYLKPIFIPSYEKSSTSSGEGLSEQGINCMYKESESRVWIGTDGGGINLFNVETKKITHYPKTSALKVVSIVPWSNKELLISVFSKGLYIFNKESGIITSFLIVDKEVNRAVITRGISINLVAYDDRVYILGGDNFVYNKQSKEFSSINQQQGISILGGMRVIAQNDSCAYLIDYSGVFRLLFNKNFIEPYYLPGPKGELLNTATIDSLGRLWFCIGDGLQLWTPKMNTAQLITKTSNLRINLLVADKNNNIWIGAGNSLYAYNNDNLQLFDNAMGYYSSEFHPKGSVVMENGDVLIGGGSGFVHIPSDIHIPLAVYPKLRIESIHVNGGEVYIERETELNVVNIPYSNNSIQVELLLNSEDIFYKKRFRYSLNDIPSLETSDYRLSLGSLKTGTHDLYVQYITVNGVWTPPQKIATLFVDNAWWRELSFISLCILVVIGFVTLLFSLYKRKKMRQHQWELYSQQEKINDQKIRFLININHELRTPLTLIYAPLKRVMEGVQSKEEVEKLISHTLKHVVRMKHIIDMILDMRKLEHGDEILHKNKFKLNQWLESFIQNFCIETESKGINLIFTPNHQIGIVNFDNHKLELIISNILSNAIKFSPRGSNIEIKTEMDEDDVKVFIIDEGSGIQGDAGSLFEPFYQENHNKAGTGLGLSYTRKMVELHNGKVGCRNNIDKKGAEFWFTIPLDDSRCTAITAVSDMIQSSKMELDVNGSVLLKELSILIVEDESQLRSFLSNTLKGVFKKVYDAPNGKVALDIVKSRLPDIVISDVMMPIMDGFMLCKSIKSDSDISHIPVILLTACTDENSMSTGYKLGADHYLSKPFDVGMVLTIIQNILKHRVGILEKATHSAVKIEPKIVTFSISDENFVRKLNQIIESQIDNPNLNVESISLDMAMSRTSLYNKMKAVIGIGVNSYIVRLRIDRARQLLSTTELSISEISDQLGFSSQRYFCTIFKQEQKITPTQYRKDMK